MDDHQTQIEQIERDYQVKEMIFTLIKPFLPLPFCVYNELIRTVYGLAKRPHGRKQNMYLNYLSPMFCPGKLYVDNTQGLVKRYGNRSNNVHDHRIAALLLYLRRYYAYDELRTVRAGLNEPVVLCFCTDVPNRAQKCTETIQYEILYTREGGEAKVMQRIVHNDASIRNIVIAHNREQYEYYEEKLITGTLLAIQETERKTFTPATYSIVKVSR